MFDSFHALADYVTKNFTSQILEVKKVIEQTPAEQLSLKPGKKKWSYLECIDHLNKTNYHYFGQIKWHLDRDVENRLAEEQPFKTNWFSRWLIKNQKPTEKQEIKWKSKTFEFTRPSENAKLSPETTLHLFIETIDFGLEQLRRIKGNQYNSLKINSLGGPFLKFSLGEAFLIVVNHNERHLLQGKKVIELG